MKQNVKTIIAVLSLLCIVSIVIMIVALCCPHAEITSFVPPVFDDSAVSGVPIPPDGLGWNMIHQEGMTYQFGICGKTLKRSNGEVDVYFYNSPENSVWLKLRILDENNEVLCETGLIKPGEFIQTIEIPENAKSVDKIKMKIMAYQPKTYYSEGSVALNTILQSESEQ